jgi:hypothetical protein
VSVFVSDLTSDDGLSTFQSINICTGTWNFVSGHSRVFFRSQLAQLQLDPGHLPNRRSPSQHRHVRTGHAEGSRILANRRTHSRKVSFKTKEYFADVKNT